MKSIEIALKDLKPNPWKAHIEGGEISEARVSELMESMEKHELWHQWVGRKNKDGEYEIAFGHHRLEAAIRLYGKNTKVRLQVENYSDDRMFTALADENAGDGASERAREDTVVIAQDILKKHPEKCVLKASRSANDQLAQRDKQAETQHECGSERCISAFLGEKNWTKTKVHDLLTFHNKVAKEVKGKVCGPTGHMPGRPRKTEAEQIRQSDALALASLDDAAQVAAADEIIKAQQEGVDLTTQDVKAAAKKAKKVKSPREQKKAVVQELKVRVRRKKDSKLRDANAVATHIVGKLSEVYYKVLESKDFETIVANRAGLKECVREDLEDSLEKLAKAAQKALEHMRAPEPRHPLYGHVIHIVRPKVNIPANPPRPGVRPWSRNFNEKE